MCISSIFKCLLGGGDGCDSVIGGDGGRVVVVVVLSAVLRVADLFRSNLFNLIFGGGISDVGCEITQPQPLTTPPILELQTMLWYCLNQFLSMFYNLLTFILFNKQKTCIKLFF